MANGTYAEHDRTPGSKLLLTILIGLALSLPLFSVWLLVYDRQNQSEQAAASITEGWGGPQIISGPLLVIPYRAVSTETALESGKSVTRTREVMRELILSPEAIDVSTDLKPDVRKRSIYEAVVYDAKVGGKARFAFPSDLARHGVPLTAMDLARAELRFGLSDPRGLGANPRVNVDGRALRLQPGGGSTGGQGFFAPVDANQLAVRPMLIEFDYEFRGNASLGFVPNAGTPGG